MSGWKIKAEKKKSERDNAIKEALTKLPEDKYEVDVKIRELSATALAKKVANKEYTALRTVEAYIRGSISVLYERALGIARALDKHQASTGNTIGPLHGVPISVKDMVNIKDVDSTIGFTNWIGNRATDDSAIVKILVHAGAIPIVKTNIPQTMLSFECSNPLWGRTVNPYNKDYTSGGSSGGEAALLASKGAAAGLGTDIGGSLRIPTSYCGTYSIKPSFGRWPLKDMKSGFEGIKATVGPMTRSVEDLELVARTVFNSTILTDVAESSIAPVPYRTIELPKKIRFGYYTDNNFVKSSPAVRRAVFETVEKLEQAGHECIDVGPVDAESAMEIFIALSAADGFKTLMSPLGGDPREPALFLIALGAKLPSFIRHLAAWALESFTPNAGFAKVLRESGEKSVQDYYRWTTKRNEFAKEFRNEVFKKHKLDGLIAPVQSMPNVPHTLTKYLNMIAAETITYNVTDSTVGVLPVTKVDKNLDQLPSNYASGKSARAQLLEDRMYAGKEPVYNADKMHGLPIGIQVIAEKAYEDERVIELMKVIDSLVN
ncbi:amidase signature enzyme [Wallemia mellicola]|uniref:amidase n=1 Tax=Wallemia mellicola TaxID=1708541 RepID=A0AB74KCK1_9BASI|nr:amidase signature enzyme [Wallemia mellicola]